MATQIETEVKVTVNVIPALATALEKGEKEAAKAGARFVTYADVLRKEAAKLDLSQDDASLTLRQSYVLATKGYTCTLVKLGTAKNAKVEVQIPDGSNYTVADVQKELDRIKFDVSKVMKLAFPENDSAKAELEKAAEHNSKIADYRKRVGVNDLLEIARGKVTLDALLNPPAPAAPAAPQAPAGETPAPAGEAPASGDAPQAPAPAEAPQAPANGGGPLSVTDRFQGALEACKMDGLTYPDALKILNSVYGRQ